MLKKVLVSNKGKDQVREILQNELGDLAQISYLPDYADEQRAKALEEADVLIVYQMSKEITEEEFGLLGNIPFLQTIWAGVENLPFAELPASLTVCANTGALASVIAEHALAMILALSKDLNKNHADLAQGDFRWKSKTKLLRGGVAGIIGFGGTGRATAQLLRPLGLRIFGMNTSGRVDPDADFMGTMADLEKVLRASDVVLLSVPLTKKTRDLMGPKELGWMKDDAVLVNLARAEIVQQKALFEHMRAHPDFRVGTDVWWMEPFTTGEFRLEHPFFELPNFLGSPHNAVNVADQTQMSWTAAAKNVRRMLTGQKPKGVMERSDYI